MIDLVSDSQTWHHGLVAKWWSEFSEDGPEIAYFRKFVERGQPALDVACGTGRLLIPFVADGLDVDGCDVSTDMIALCRENAEKRGLSPTLFVQAMHELEPTRRYRTIFVCGGFGLGSTRRQDEEGLPRVYEHLGPGGRAGRPSASFMSPSGPAAPSFSTTRPPTRPAIRGGTGRRRNAA